VIGVNTAIETTNGASSGVAFAIAAGVIATLLAG
jgi:S1-C subfamily serine protease